MTIKIIGVHSGHDASACLLIDNCVVATISKERLTRIKHDSGEPVECIAYLLGKFNLSSKDIDLVVRSQWHDASEINDAYYDIFDNVIVTYKHHFLHAYSASIMAKSAEAIILVNDGRGCRPQDNDDYRYENEDYFETESVYYYHKGYITPLEKIYKKYLKNQEQIGNFIDSIGYAYRLVSRMIFKSDHAAGKVMALAALGSDNPDIPETFLSEDPSQTVVNPAWLNFIKICSAAIDWDWHQLLARQIAFKLQLSLENYFSFRSIKLIEKYRLPHLLLGGGVALNCKSNGLIVNIPVVHTMGVFPASGDDGLSVGAAIWQLREKFGNFKPITYHISQGFNYDVKNSVSEKTVNRIVELLNQENIIAIHNKGSEFGPRALGYRSILAVATNLQVKNYLNINVKRREIFRPFGGIILRRNLEKLTSDKLASDYMLSAVHVNPEITKEYPALVHIDNTARIQVIDEDSSLLYKILEQYEYLTNNFILINTSFNGKDEPIVETPENARECAKSIGIKYLYINNHLEVINEQ